MFTGRVIARVLSHSIDVLMQHPVPVPLPTLILSLSGRHRTDLRETEPATALNQETHSSIRIASSTANWEAWGSILTDAGVVCSPGTHPTAPVTNLSAQL